MTNRIRHNAIFGSIVFVANCSFANPFPPGTQESVLKLKVTIQKVRTEPTLALRTKAAQHLADLTESMDPQLVDELALAQMIALLDSPEDSVRAWVAGSIGFLGPRAKSAAPRLLKLLPEADKLPGSLTSSPAIRLALTRIGVPPPPLPGESPRK